MAKPVSALVAIVAISIMTSVCVTGNAYGDAGIINTIEFQILKLEDRIQLLKNGDDTTIDEVTELYIQIIDRWAILDNLKSASDSDMICNAPNCLILDGPLLPRPITISAIPNYQPDPRLDHDSNTTYEFLEWLVEPS